MYITVDHEVDVITLTEEAEPENSVSKAEGYNNIAGWLCFTAPKLSKLGRRKSSPDQTLESEFVVSECQCLHHPNVLAKPVEFSD